MGVPPRRRPGLPTVEAVLSQCLGGPGPARLAPMITKRRESLMPPACHACTPMRACTRICGGEASFGPRLSDMPTDMPT